MTGLSRRGAEHVSRYVALSPWHGWLLILILAVAPAGFGQRAEPGAAREALTGTDPAAQAPVLGAIWVGTAGGYYRDAPRTDQLILALRDTPFTDFLIQVRAHGDAWYQSQLVPKAAGLTEHFDPLATLLRGLHAEPHKRRAIAWLAPYQAGKLGDATPAAANDVRVAHPEWLSLRQGGGKTDQDGNMYLEPGLSAVQQHLEAVVKELAGNYEIDGIYFDPLSDPGPDWGYHPTVVSDWQQRVGSVAPKPDDPAWIAHRAELLTRSLNGLMRAAREARPGIVVGVGARADGPCPAEMTAFHQSEVYSQYHQDWPQWMIGKERPEHLYLKNFRAEETAGPAFDAWMKLALTLGGVQGRPVVIGVDGGINDSLGALAQLRRAAEAGAEGLALYDYDQPVRDASTRTLFLNAIGRTVLSPDYVQMVAATAQARRQAGLSAPPGAGGAGVAAAGAKDSDLAAAQAALAPLRGRAAARPAAPAAAAGGPGADAELPPPPTDIQGVPDETTGRPGTPVEEAEGRLLPARPSRSAAAGRQGDREPSPSRPSGSGARGPAAWQPPPAPPRTPANLSTQEMLNELITDPNYAGSREWNLLRPDEQAMDYLKKNYGNIF